jgi:hypothetical protein
MDKHKFNPAVWNSLVCGTCLHKAEQHSCEACDNTDPYVYYVNKKMLLCDACFAKHNEAYQRTDNAIKSDQAHKLSLEQIINQVNRLVDVESPIKTMTGETINSIIDNAIKGNIQKFTDFFNAQIPAIVELKQQCDENTDLVSNDEKRYALAAMLRGRVQYLSRVLFQFNAKELEVGAEIRSIQQYLNQMIPQLRAELRAEYQKDEPKYAPPIKETKETKPKLSLEDKMAEKYAAMMKIPIERARHLLKNKLKEDDIVCSCAETPGICKLHKVV